MEAIEAFESLLKEYNGSIIFVSHDRKFIEKVATRIMTIDNKEIKYLMAHMNNLNKLKSQ